MQVHNKQFRAPIEKVPCPWCKTILDCQDLEMELLSAMQHDQMIDQAARVDGLTVGADRPSMECVIENEEGQRIGGCGRSIIIQQVQKRTFLIVRQDHR